MTLCVFVFFVVESITVGQRVNGLVEVPPAILQILLTAVYNNSDRMKAWGKSGAFWGGIWGMLFGSAFFWVPGIGPLLVAGPLIGLVVGALEGAVVVGGLSALGAGLYGIGIPKDSILLYETALKTGKFLLIAHGTSDDVSQAKEILHRTNAASLESH